MPYAELEGGIRIRYAEDGHGPALVLAHGFGVSLEMWGPQAGDLAEHYRFIGWDARGHGDSSAPADPAAYSMPQLAADLRGLLEALGVADGAIVGGMSFGGQIALQYATEYPASVRALILSDAVTRSGLPIAAEAIAVPSMFGGNPGLAGCYRAMQSRPDLTPLLPTLTMPVLVIYGDDDDYVLGGIPRLIEGLPNRRVVRMSGAGHGTSAQRPREWSQAVLGFLSDVSAGIPVHGEVRV